MKKYLLIIKSFDNIYYETWDSYNGLMWKVSFVLKYDCNSIVKWYRIDNLNENPSIIFKILKSLNDFIAKNWSDNYGK